MRGYLDYALSSLVYARHSSLNEVQNALIAGALADVSGEQVDKRTIVVTNPIKSLGAHEVSVKLHDDVSATVALNVIPA